ncbi:MAG: DUF389 domain-containing protein, partial [Chloroflexota bacterium]
MDFPEQPAPPPEPWPPERPPASRARRRRARRTFFPRDAEGRAAVLEALAHRAYPTLELFIFSLLCGAILGLGYILDSQGLLFFGILLAPLMAPWVGLTLASVSGAPRLFAQTLAGLLVSAFLVFLAGALSGLASRLFEPLTLTQAFLHSRLWIPDLVILALGAVLLTASFVRSEDKPYLPSVLVAYELFLPLSAGGFGVGSGVGDLWPHGVLVFTVNLAWATLFGLLTLVALRFRPLSAAGYGFALAVLAVSISTVVWLAQPGRAPSPPATAPTATSLPAATPLPSQPPSATPPPTATQVLLRPTATESTPEADTPTASPTSATEAASLPAIGADTTTPFPESTPIYALIRAREGGGAFLRKEPGGSVLATLDNGSIVQILPGTQEKNGAVWIHVIVTRDEIRVEGWIIQDVLETATPVPNWEASETPTPEP